MARLVIEGIPGLDGEYETDFTYFTNREWHTIKVVAGVRMGEFQDALDAQDNDLVVALAVIGLERRSISVNAERLWDAPAGKITVIDDVEVADAGPPAPAPSKPTSGDAESGVSSATLSGGTGAAGQVTTLRPTGTQASAIGATSA